MDKWKGNTLSKMFHKMPRKQWLHGYQGIVTEDWFLPGSTDSSLKIKKDNPCVTD